MKLKQLLLFTLCIAFFACSSDSSDDSGEKIDNSTLIKRIVYDEGTDDENTAIFNYFDGNKLSSIDYDDGDKNVYTYDGDLLINEDVYFGNELAVNVTLEYNNDGVLTQMNEYWFEPTEIGNERAYKHIFTYNSDNSITNEVYIGDHSSQTELSYTETILFDGKNISGTEYTDGMVEYIYTYDDKNGMFKNIHAIDILNLLSENEFGPYMFGYTNNIISDKEIYNSESTDDTYEYTYNENNYPISAVGKRFYNEVAEEDSEFTINFYYE